MSLGIVFKGPEGVVLVADSRVTLNMDFLDPNTGIKTVFPCSYDNANKLLRFKSQKYVGAITWGLGAFGSKTQRTPNSYLPEFEEELQEANIERLDVIEFASKLGDFFMRKWSESGMPNDWPNDNMLLAVAGYDARSAYGKVVQIAIPSQPTPIILKDDVDFGITWGGQREYTDRIMQGYDWQIIPALQAKLNLTQPQVQEIETHLQQNFSIRIPYEFLPLQDCVDFSIFLVRTTISIHNWILNVRGVGGSIDVATITRTEGFKFIQNKEVKGERQ